MGFVEFIEKQKWTSAKTYAKTAPHEYIVRDKIVGNDEEFVNAVMTIREKGFRAKFWSKEYIYLHYNGFFYWTMGEPIERTIIINRCSKDNYELSIRFKGNAEEQNGNNLQGK